MAETESNVEETTTEETPADERLIIYEKGYPFYKLKKKEIFPSMNLLKTFNAKVPDCRDFLKDFKENIWSEQYTDAFLLILVDVKIFALKHDFNCSQTAALYEIVYSCFQYFQMLPTLKKDAFLNYFRETLLLYSVQDPPERLRLFNAIEGFAIAKLFHILVANNFEMMKYVLVPIYSIEIDTEDSL